MFTYEYIEKRDREYMFARYYNNVFDGYAIFSLNGTLDLLRNPEQLYDENTKSFLEHLKLKRL